MQLRVLCTVYCVVSCVPRSFLFCGLCRCTSDTDAFLAWWFVDWCPFCVLHPVCLPGSFEQPTPVVQFLLASLFFFAAYVLFGVVCFGPLTYRFSSVGGAATTLFAVS